MCIPSHINSYRKMNSNIKFLSKTHLTERHNMTIFLLPSLLWMAVVLICSGGVWRKTIGKFSIFLQKSNGNGPSSPPSGIYSIE